MKIPECHLLPATGTPLKENAVHPLGDSFPYLDKGASIDQILDVLDVEHSARYARGPNFTRCNVYAHDLHHLCGVYIPRTWWDAAAMDDMEHGVPVAAKYPAFKDGHEVPNSGTIHEMNANALAEWALKYAKQFGWDVSVWTKESEATIETFAAGMTEGSHRPGFIVARAPGRIGHISAIIPRSVKDADKHPLGILQSEAGASNRRLYSQETGWWANPKHGFDLVVFGWSMKTPPNFAQS